MLARDLRSLPGTATASGQHAGDRPHHQPCAPTARRRVLTESSSTAAPASLLPRFPHDKAGHRQSRRRAEFLADPRPNVPSNSHTRGALASANSGGAWRPRRLPSSVIVVTWPGVQPWPANQAAGPTPAGPYRNACRTRSQAARSCSSDASTSDSRQGPLKYSPTKRLPGADSAVTEARSCSASDDAKRRPLAEIKPERVPQRGRAIIHGRPRSLTVD
jgi:hypothetical protein